MKISELPEDCLSHVLSLTSTSDVLRSSAVSKCFFSASVSDNVWEKFLPSDIITVVSQFPPSLPQFDSKKELFLHLCRSPILYHNDSKSFALDKWSGKKCYMLGARALEIAWGFGKTPWHWNFKSANDSRFPEVARLKNVCWLEIKGKIHIKLLSPNITYGAYIIFKMNSGYVASFNKTPVKVTVLEIDEEDEGPPRNLDHPMVVKSYYMKPAKTEEHANRVKIAFGELPVDRRDGWMEIEMGKYQVGVDGGLNERAILEMTLWEVEEGNMKSGLLVQGIELRPLN